MKKAIKRTLWITGILFGLLILAAIAFLIYFRSATKEMTPAETKGVNDSVFCIKNGFVNAYIFKSKNQYILFDAGMSEKRFLAEMKSLKIMPEQISSVFLTHTDGDHTGAMGLFKNCIVYMHKDEEQMINGQNSKGPFKTIWKYGPYRLLNNNDTIRIDGLRISIIHTPGHTPGSSCYSVNDNYLITGDNINVVEGKADHFVEMFNMDTEKQIESIKVLPELNIFQYILTAHHGIFKN
jgi:glyoxylase-like metal-dependent hydrolase (beta-lactamase superfamily II)